MNLGRNARMKVSRALAREGLPNVLITKAEMSSEAELFDQAATSRRISLRSAPPFWSRLVIVLFSAINN